MYNIFQKQIYIKHYNIIRAWHGKLTSIKKNHNVRPVRLKGKMQN